MDNDQIEISTTDTNKKNKGTTKLEILYIIIFYILIFQDFLQRYITPLQYFDELLGVIGIIASIYILIKNKFKLKKSNLIFTVSIIIISIIGFYSVLKYKYQTLLNASIDWMLVIKFFAVYSLSQIAFKRILKDKDNRVIRINIQIIIIILFVLTILNYMFNIYDGQIRLGMKSNKLFFGHQSRLAAVCVALLANNIMFSKKINNVYNYMILLVLFSTLRLKAIADAVVSLILIIYITKTNKKLSLLKIGIVGIICVIIAYGQIYSYFVKLDGSARRVLSETSIKIANDYFPIGTGFGTYGSYISGENYSAVYSLYGINNVYGLSQNEAGFVSDTFWPMIVGQFGYLGTLCYLICIILIYRDIQKEYSVTEKKKYLAKILCLLYLIISSTSESAFVHPMAIPLALVLGL